MKTFAQRVTELEAQRTPKHARMTELAQLALDDDEREFTAEEQAEFDGLRAEVAAIDKKLSTFRALDSSVSTAKHVGTIVDTEGASASRGGMGHNGGSSLVPAEAKSQEEKGLDFVRMVKCFVMAEGKPRDALEIAKSRYPKHKGIHMMLDARIKAQVAGATTDDPSWAAPLVDQPQRLIGEFIEYLMPKTIIGQLGQNGIPDVTRVPFNIEVPGQASQGDAQWVGEGRPIPLTSFSFENITLRWNRVGSIVALSKRLIQMSSGSAETLIRKAMTNALVRRIDLTLLDPSVAVSGDVRPASLTNGAQTYVSFGIDADSVRADIKRLLTYFTTNNIDLSSVVFAMRANQAVSLSLMRNAMGIKEFPDMTPKGGILEGFPVLVSNHIGTGVVIAFAADEVYLADEGGISMEMSTEASLEMATDPTNAITDLASPPQPVETTQVSMFQTSSVALKIERTLTWRKRRAAGAVYQTATGWGNPATSPPQAAI